MGTRDRDRPFFSPVPSACEDPELPILPCEPRSERRAARNPSLTVNYRAMTLNIPASQQGIETLAVCKLVSEGLCCGMVA